MIKVVGCAARLYARGHSTHAEHHLHHHKDEVVDPHHKAVIAGIFGGVVNRYLRSILLSKFTWEVDAAAT